MMSPGPSLILSSNSTVQLLVVWIRLEVKLLGKSITRSVQVQFGSQLKAGNIVVVKRVFDALDNEHGIKDMLCTYQGDLHLVHTTLEAKITIISHINNAESVKELEE